MPFTIEFLELGVEGAALDPGQVGARPVMGAEAEVLVRRPSDVEDIRVGGGVLVPVRRRLLQDPCPVLLAGSHA
jgi:hypothetical protein